MSEVFAAYNIFPIFQLTHKRTLELAASLTEEQIAWKPEGYSNSINFHLWHLARWTDVLQARVASRFPERQSDFGDGQEIWVKENLAQKWGFPDELGYSDAGTGLGDDDANKLPVPHKDERR